VLFLQQSIKGKPWGMTSSADIGTGWARRKGIRRPDVFNTLLDRLWLRFRDQSTSMFFY
jgi:hypothetical protein